MWIMGDTAADDRNRGMGIVVEYANRTGKPQWSAPSYSKWNYTWFGSVKPAPAPVQTFDMTFTKANAADQGFNRWKINGASYPDTMMPMPAAFHLEEGKRYRIRMRNASDDIHPIHLHRHIFELTNVAGQRTSGIMKDVVMVGGYQTVEVDFVANNPGLTLFHCHQQLHMDFGFMTLFNYV
jgi:FtsP/CotA-like multicopper oxidase with cupredoxin domain